MSPQLAPQTPPPTSPERGDVDLLLAVQRIARCNSVKRTVDHGGTAIAPPALRADEVRFAVRRKDIPF